MATKQPIVGLFGTCGDSLWRRPLIQEFNERGIPFFNPQVAADTWHAGLLADENRHMREDVVLLFPVTAETTGAGSLAEIGFSILNALRSTENRYIVVLIDDDCTDATASDDERKNSVRARKLVKSKVRETAAANPRVFLVEDMAALQKLALSLYDVAEREAEIAEITTALHARYVA